MSPPTIGVVLISPVYVHTVTALMKNFFDRFAYVCHQPRFLGKTSMLIVTTELSGAEETLEYMAFPVFTWGFKNVANLGVVYESFLNEGEYRTKTLKRISESAHDFYEAITKPRSKPTFRELMFFNVMKRKVTLHRQMLPQDYNYWKEVGWLERVFYYEDDIPVFKGMLARLLATIRVRQVTKKYGLDVSLN